MVRCIASFSLGITAYRLRGVPSIRKWLENSNVSSLLCIITLGLACIPNADVFVVMTFPALVTSLSLHKSGISSFLSSKATYSLGLWSYSLYLVHLPFRPAQISLAATLSASIPWGASVLASVLILTVVLMLSMVTYFAIEKPSRTLLQSVLRLRADSASNTKCESSSRSSAQMADPHG
jgi:peptidoglycan/LPS O-acetylase OafA/YrhL